MSLLLDTHTVVWWIRSDQRLSMNARALIGSSSNEVFVSVATAWEIAIKVGLGRWPEASELLTDFEAALSVEGFRLLYATVPHVRAAGLMSVAHRDPFDRLLAAQAMAEGLTVVTADAKIVGLGAAGPGTGKGGLTR